MKRTVLALMLVLAGAGALVAIARDGGAERTAGRRRVARTRVGARNQASVAEAVSRLDLSPQELAEVDKILKEAGEASQEAGEKRDEKMAELRKELAEAREDGGDREAMREIFGKMRALRGTGQARTDLVKKIEGALGDDGVAAFKKALASPGRSSRISTLLQGISQLNLSLRQQRQVDKVLDAAIDKIKKTLTPAQRAKLKAAAARNAERRAGGRRGGGRARTE